MMATFSYKENNIMNSLFFKFIVILSIILLSSCNAPLSDSRVLSVLVSEDDNQTRTIFVGTDGGGMNWGRVEKENILPANWHREVGGQAVLGSAFEWACAKYWVISIVYNYSYCITI